ncbi:MAG TPA: M14 family metallopeptidase, partial [Caulobacteraceae bacterium]|nr:M14 family metallopeptidase [Caulobacteraceae bacterium]
MNSADSFSADYPQARSKFREAAAGAGGALEAMVHPERGPDGGELATDVAWFGARDAPAVLVMISGTHGVEGFCGSGAQVDWLRRGGTGGLPAGVAVLMIHAVNPYGFAWLRRVTNENVDLNRNWIDFSQPLPANPGYAELADAICPTEWTQAAQAASFQALGGFIAAKGMMAMQQAVSGGQYSHPKGVFYGGAGPTWSRKTQTAIFEHYLKGSARVGIIDYHTGLGPWGYGEQIITDAVGSPGYDRARRWYGAAVTSPSSGTSTSADIVGDGLAAAPVLLAHAEVTGVALEVGTHDTMTVINALRADAWLHAYGDPTSEQGRAIKTQIRDAFYGDADDWKGMVAGQSLLAVKQALAGLAG